MRIKREDFKAVVDAGATGSGAAPAREPGPTAEDFWLGNLAVGELVFKRDEAGT